MTYGLPGGFGRRCAPGAWPLHSLFNRQHRLHAPLPSTSQRTFALEQALHALGVRDPPWFWSSINSEKMCKLKGRRGGVRVPPPGMAPTRICRTRTTIHSFVSTTKSTSFRQDEFMTLDIIRIKNSKLMPMLGSSACINLRPH